MSRLLCALGPDSAGTLLHRFLRDARDRLDAAVYEVGPSYAWAFPLAARRGVRVRLLLDGHGGANRGCLEALRRDRERHGTVVPCRLRMHAHQSEAHWKLLVADRDRLAVGTGNLIERDAPGHAEALLPPDGESLPGTREWWVFVDGAPGLAAGARARISTVWRQSVPAPRLWTVEALPEAPPIGAPRPAVAPLGLELSSRRLQLATDARTVQDMISLALEGATRRALVTVPYVHTWAHPVRPLLDCLSTLRRQRGDVRMLLGTPPTDGDAATLRDRRIPTRVMDPRRCTTGHAKGLIADQCALITSANWSNSGLGVSLEAALRIDHPDAAEYFASAFERDWETAARV